jgi:hypothetical protein
MSNIKRPREYPNPARTLMRAASRNSFSYDTPEGYGLG